MARINNVPVIQDEESYDETDSYDSSVGSGWATPPPPKSVSAPKLEIALKDNEEHIIKIHEPFPRVKYQQHAVQLGGWKYFTCMAVRDPKTKQLLVHCPLCDVGDWPKDKMMLNITDMAEPDKLITWTFGFEVQQQLQKFMKGPKDDEGKPTEIPLNREDRYFLVQRNEEPRVNYSVLPLKARDLQDDHNREPLTESELEKLMEKPFGKEVVWHHSEQDIQDAADRLPAKK